MTLTQHYLNVGSASVQLGQWWVSVGTAHGSMVGQHQRSWVNGGSAPAQLGQWWVSVGTAGPMMGQRRHSWANGGSASVMLVPTFGLKEH